MPGAAAVIVKEYNVRDHTNHIIHSYPVVLFVREKGGQYKGKLNIPGGKYENRDGTFFRTAKREVSEEVTLMKPSKNELLQEAFGKERPPDGKVNGTPIWCVKISGDGISRKMFIPNSETSEMNFIPLWSIKQHLKDPNIPIRDVDGNPQTVTHYALEAIKQVQI